MLDNITKAADAIEPILYGGHIGAILAVLAGLLLALFLAVLLLIFLAKRYQRKIDEDPVTRHAARLEQFYMDRTLPAEIRLEYRTRKDRREAMRSDFPDCSPDALKNAVREAEYNEFVQFELDREMRALRQRTGNGAAARRALKRLAELRRRLPHGAVAIFECRRAFPKIWRYKLDDAHTWLDEIAPGTHDVPSGDAFEAIKAHMYRCAYCKKDLNEDIVLTVVKTEKGAAVPACRACVQKAGRKKPE